MRKFVGNQSEATSKNSAESHTLYPNPIFIHWTHVLTYEPTRVIHPKTPVWGPFVSQVATFYLNPWRSSTTPTRSSHFVTTDKWFKPTKKFLHALQLVILPENMNVSTYLQSFQSELPRKIFYFFQTIRASREVDLKPILLFQAPIVSILYWCQSNSTICLENFRRVQFVFANNFSTKFFGTPKIWDMVICNLAVQVLRF